MKIHVEATYEKMSIKAADLFCEELQKKPHGVYSFATGSTPLGLYKELVKRYKNNEIDFQGVSTFNLDEYYPIKKTNNQSYYFFMMENLFNLINIQKKNIEIPNGEANDPRKECLRYDRLIKEKGIDLQILGIGENGHIGFNEPAEKFSEGTNYASLTDSTIKANSRFFSSMEEVPKHAITMGIDSIMQSKKIILLASGSNKSDILHKALFEEVTPRVPASILQFHPDVTVITDKEAGKLIKNSH